MGHKEGWTIKKAEHGSIDAFKLWCWRRLLRVPGTARRWNQSILKEINPEYSLEGLTLKLKLKLQYFGHLMCKADSWEKTLMLEKTEGRRRRGRQRKRWLDGITDSTYMNLSKFREIVRDRGAWHDAVHGVSKSWTQLSDWTTTKNDNLTSLEHPKVNLSYWTCLVEEGIDQFQWCQTHDVSHKCWELGVNHAHRTIYLSVMDWGTKKATGQEQTVNIEAERQQEGGLSTNQSSKLLAHVPLFHGISLTKHKFRQSY